EILRQVEVTRTTPGATGNVHFSMKAFTHDFGGINGKLKAGPYAEPALVPESPWLGKDTPQKPAVNATGTPDGIQLRMKLATDQSPWQWVVRTQHANGWKTTILPGETEEYHCKMGDGTLPISVVVSAVTRLGREGPATNVTLPRGP
ncbi:MAG: hypothetical protein IT425_12040, partial [Pirellulales bacterium]|nr:hypothetical protein [Pirellulales bacterium]